MTTCPVCNRTHSLPRRKTCSRACIGALNRDTNAHAGAAARLPVWDRRPHTGPNDMTPHQRRFLTLVRDEGFPELGDGMKHKSRNLMVRRLVDQGLLQIGDGGYSISPAGLEALREMAPRVGGHAGR